MSKFIENTFLNRWGLSKKWLIETINDLFEEARKGTDLINHQAKFIEDLMATNREVQLTNYALIKEINKLTKDAA